MIRAAAANYLLDAGIQWGAAPAVKVRILLSFLFCRLQVESYVSPYKTRILQGVRDAAVDLLHTLVAVHAEVLLSILKKIQI